MLLRAIMLRARMQLLPRVHPAAALVQLATHAHAPSWASAVTCIQTDSRLPQPIPSITDTLNEGTIAHVRTDRDARRKCLASYKWQQVVPALRCLDETAFHEATNKSSWPYASFQPQFCTFPDELLNVNWGPNTWYHYRAWAVVRATGRLPLRIFGDVDEGFPVSLEPCIHCGADLVDVRHLLAHCPATFDAYITWWSASGRQGKPGNRLPWHLLRMELFAGRLGYLTTNPDEGASRIQYVGSVCKQLVVARNARRLDNSIDQLLQSAQHRREAEVPPRDGS